MMPLATTELGTDGAITGIMEDPHSRGLPPSLGADLHVGHHGHPALLLRRSHRAETDPHWASHFVPLLWPSLGCFPFYGKGIRHYLRLCDTVWAW